MSDWDLEDVAALMKNQQNQWNDYYSEKKSYEVWDWFFGIFKTIFTIPIYLFIILALFGLLGK